MTTGASRAESPAGGLYAARVLARVAATQALGSLLWLTLDIPGWPSARPGQFALLQASDSCCFLGRPLSVAREEGELVSFLIAPVGEGTRELCALCEGDRVWALGPLGNGFDLRALTAGPGRLVIVAGGVGAAPFPLLLSRLPIEPATVGATAPAGTRVDEVLVLLGFRDAAQAAGARPVLAEAEALQKRGMACRAVVVTEDGTLGRAEIVTHALQRELMPGDRLAVCGPWAMANAVARAWAESPEVEAWFSLEAGMACGVGSCHGCAILLADGSAVRVCREGPVFGADAMFRRDFGRAVGQGEA